MLDILSSLAKSAFSPGMNFKFRLLFSGSSSFEDNIVRLNSFVSYARVRVREIEATCNYLKRTSTIFENLKKELLKKISAQHWPFSVIQINVKD